MDPILTLFVAMIVVVGGVLFFRLHAFLALFAGALAVGLLTSSQAVLHSELRSSGTVINRSQMPSDSLQVQEWMRKHPVWYVYRDDGDNLALQHTLNATQPAGAAVAASEPRDQYQFDLSGVELPKKSLWVPYAAVIEAERIAADTVGQRIASGFGSTCMKIGILIAMASIIGKTLLLSGAALRVVQSATRLLGEQKTSLALVSSGFVVGIPVFFDTVFYLLMPLAKAMRLKTGRNYLLYVLAIVVGASIAHSLVPPTPGPLFVAGELGISVGLMMLGGGAVGIGAVIFGYLYALWANKRWEIPLRDLQSDSAEEKYPEKLPPLWLSLLPILVPVVFLGGKTILDLRYDPADRVGWFLDVTATLELLGDKNIALAIAAAIGLLMLLRYHVKGIRISTSMQDAIYSAGNIILITAAGGAFGHVLRQTGIATTLQRQFSIDEAGLGLLLVAFALTATVRVAQGSATVAMITSVGIMGPLIASLSLPYHPLYVALAIGCGSKPLPWMNDSGFWIVSRMAGLTEVETLKTYTVALTIMGFVGLILVLLGAHLFPLPLD